MKNQTEMVKEDEPFSLECIVTGTPKPTIQWMKVSCHNIESSQKHFVNYVFMYI